MSEMTFGHYSDSDSDTKRTVPDFISKGLLLIVRYLTFPVCEIEMSSKSSQPQFPGLPPGMPNPEAIFDSWWPIIIAVVAGVVYAIRSV